MKRRKGIPARDTGTFRIVFEENKGVGTSAFILENKRRCASMIQM
jgi:hypothetical protein